MGDQGLGPVAAPSLTSLATEVLDEGQRSSRPPEARVRSASTGFAPHALGPIAVGLPVAMREVQAEGKRSGADRRADASRATRNPQTGRDAPTRDERREVQGGTANGR